MMSRMSLRSAPLLRTFAIRAVHELLLARLKLDGWLASTTRRPRTPRILASACETFPIYSQTFVHQEVVSLARSGVAVRFLYGRAASLDELAVGCRDLWPMSRRVLLHPVTGAADYAHFRRRMPRKVAAVTAMVAEGAGLTNGEVESNEHFLEAFSFARAAELWGAEYLHSYFFYEHSLFALVASHLLEIPRGVSCYADHLLRDYALKIVPVHLRTCDIVVATSRRIQTELETIHGAPLSTVVVKPNAIDASRFAAGGRGPRAEGSSLRLACVSRLDPKKGLEYVLDAVRLLVERGIRVELEILGAADAASIDGQEYEAALRARVARLNLTSAVSFAGRQDGSRVRAALEACDVFVQPSVELSNGDKDGIPTSLLEAMAAGCAIVATDAGSIVEAVTNEREALIVPQRDGEALAGAIQRVAADPSLADRLRTAASARALREFDVALTESVFHERVRDAISRRRTRSAAFSANGARA